MTSGLIAGFFRGWVDSLLSRFIDVVLAFPILLLALGLASACSLGNGCLGGLDHSRDSRDVIVVIALVVWTYIGRIIRGQVLSLREKEFVEAARSLGASNARIMRREILPNLVAPIIVYATLILPTNILFEAALSFLGVGVQPPTASWGQMIADAYADLQHGVVVHGFPWGRAAADRARVQPGRRRAAGCAEPEGGTLRRASGSTRRISQRRRRTTKCFC